MYGSLVWEGRKRKELRVHEKKREGVGLKGKEVKTKM